MLKNLKERMVWAKETAMDQAHRVAENLRVSEKLQQERFEICRQCDYLFAATYTCTKCGCFMNVKTWMAPARCPIGKWEPVKIADHGQDH